ncbi:MAG TPA: choice-of-anchor D domain-containing protein, partial [Myxococcaceae bacterium]
SPPALDFGNRLVNNTSTRSVRLSNHCGISLTLTGIDVRGTGASRFSVAAVALPLVLGPGQEKEMVVTFTPWAEGEVSGTLGVTASELPHPLELALHGIGIPTVLAVRPSPLNFGSVFAGGGSHRQMFTLSNLSSETITLAAPQTTSSAGEPFMYDVVGLRGFVMAPRMSVIIPVDYQPRSDGLSETTLSFGTTTPPQLHAAELTMIGKARARLIRTDVEKLDFGRVEVMEGSRPQVLVLTNLSSQPQRLAVLLKQPEGTPFSVSPETLPVLPPEGSASILVSYAPSAGGGPPDENELQVWLQGASVPEAKVLLTGEALDSLGSTGWSCAAAGSRSADLVTAIALAGLVTLRKRRAPRARALTAARP